MDKKKLTVITSCLCVILLAACAVVYLREDRTGPVITMAEEKISYEGSDNVSELLKGVTATDDKDGDVTDTVKVDRVTEVLSKEYVVVTYVAKDCSNNITKKDRWVDLKDGSTSDAPMADVAELIEIQDEDIQDPPDREETEEMTES